MFILSTLLRKLFRARGRHRRTEDRVADFARALEDKAARS
jgi:hypothetical protein